MTPELVIVKIQSLLSSDNTENLAQQRAIAMEYCNQCTQVHELLEHCGAMIKAGREYSALEFAESSTLLERINTLSFKEGKIWLDYCAEKKLPSPMPFDETLVEMVSALYQKSISQTHPLYRDYRRAMRLRDFDKALSVITTISKINSTDELAKEECQRLRKSVVERKLKRLAELLHGNIPETNDEFEKICAFLERNDDYVRGMPEWTEAMKKRAEISQANLYEKAVGIVSKMRMLSPDENLDEVVSLLGELNSLPENLKLSPIDEDFIESISKYALKRQAEKISKEKIARAVVAITEELENKKAVDNKLRLEKLKKLRSEASSGLSTEIAKVLDKKISVLEKKLFMRKISLYSGIFAGVSLLGVGGYFGSIIVIDKMERKDFETSLAKISHIEDPNEKLNSLNKLEAKYRDILNDPAFGGKFLDIKKQADAKVAETDRLKKMLDFAEKINYTTASSKDVSEAKKILDKVGEDVFLLPESVQPAIKERLDKIQSKAIDKIEERKTNIRRRIRDLLKNYEELLAQYESFNFDRTMLDKRYDVIVPELRALMEDSDSIFKPDQIDIDSYNDLSNRIKDAKSKYADFDDARKSLLSSKTFEEYIAMAKLLNDNPNVPADFTKKLSKILNQTQAIKTGQLANYADASAVENAFRIGEFSRAVVKLPQLLGDVHIYVRENGKRIHSLGEAVERENKWDSGSETMQRVNEIVEGGTTNTVLYRKHQIDGQIPTGEKLFKLGLSAESKFAQEVLNIAAQDSLIEAIEYCANGNVNPVFKLILEKYLFEQMRKDPIFSGLLYSKTALAREKMVNKHARGFSFHSWLFENGPRKRFVEKELYSTPLPNLKKEAKVCVDSILIIQKNPLKMVGIVQENGKKKVFADSKGAIWAVNMAGNFSRMASSMDIMGKGSAELSPLFAEVKSDKEVNDEAVATFNHESADKSTKKAK